jgi:hypothetical protein
MRNDNIPRKNRCCFLAQQSFCRGMFVTFVFGTITVTVQNPLRNSSLLGACSQNRELIRREVLTGTAPT